MRTRASGAGRGPDDAGPAPQLLSARSIALGYRLLHLAAVNAKHQFVLAA